MYHNSNNNKKALLLLLFFFPLYFLFPAPSSFFISPSQTILNGGIVRVYSLEYGKDPLTAGNLNELSQINGSVQVFYNDGKFQEMDFRELSAKGTVNLIPHNAGEFLVIQFSDRSITRIVTGSGGVGFLHAGTAAHENRLTANNIQKIIELEKMGFSHSAIQEHILRNRILNITKTPETLTVDFQTTAAESEKVFSTFNNTAAVSYARDKRIFLRLDGLLSRNAEMSGYITELLTHFHTDHINHTAAERCLREKKFMRLIAPYPLLDASMTKTFHLLAQAAGITGAEKPFNMIMDINPDQRKANTTGISVMGDFNYSVFKAGDDITIEMFRSHTARNVNSDGIIYRITHKNVSYMLFGDFDDPEGIEKLLEIAMANEKTRIEILEERAQLNILLIKAQAENDTKTTAEVQGRIKILNERLSGLFILKADIMKWPHHAHKFPNNTATNNIIKKMNDIIDPVYIIWERHYTQNGFTDYIQRFDFVDKFLSSDETEIRIISLYQTLNRAISAFREPMLS